MATFDFDIQLCRGEFSLDVGFSMPKPGITAILGPSGCGKSTLLRALAGLEKPHGGHIRLGEKVWFDSKRGVSLKPQQRRAGFMFQHYALFPHMTVMDNIAFGAPKGALREVRNWIDRFEIAEIIDCRPDRISGGQRQRVALARALAMKPAVLLLDEPFSSVDAHLRQHLRRLVRRTAYETGIPVLLVTHDPDDACEAADLVGLMGTGCLQHFGLVDELLKDESPVLPNPGISRPRSAECGCTAEQSRVAG